MKIIYVNLVRVFCTISLFAPIQVWAQAPSALTADIPLPSDPPTNTYTNSANGPYYFTLTQITNSFNYARRAEETQLGLPANSLGTLTLPSSYASATAQERGIYLVNAERQARKNVTYPATGTALGLPLEGVETNLSAISQAHSDNIMAMGMFSHTLNGLSPADRINASSTFGGSCHEFLTRDENIYKQCLYTSSSTPPANPAYTVEQAIFSWLYQDSGASWGHRDALLMQNTSGNYPSPASPGNAYDNNYSLAANEGFLGIGITYASGNNSVTTGMGGICPPSSNPALVSKTAAVVVFNFVDPAASGCSYTLQANNPLPVNLVSFTGSARENKAVLSWITAWERTNSGFTIQRSLDGRSWEGIGFVAGKDTLTNRNLYEFDDNSVQAGTTYLYRLKQLDYDGQFTFSKIVAVTIVPADQLVYAYPNPSSQGEFHLFTTQAATTTLEMHDLLGNAYPLTSQVSGKAQLTIKMAESVPAGVYLLTVKSETALTPVKTLKVIIEH